MPRAWTAAFALALTVQVGACGRPAAPPAAASTAAAPLTAADQAAIRATDTAFGTAAGAGDAAGAAAVYLPDARLMPPNAPTVNGRDGIQRFWGGLFDAYRVRITVTSDEIEGSGDLAYARGHYTLDLTPKAGGPPAHDEGKFLEILRRKPDGTWGYAVDMYSSDLPVPK